MNSLLFLPFLDFFWAKRTKNYSCNGEFFQIFFFFSDWGFSISNYACVLFWHKSPRFWGVICWHFLPFKRVFFTIFTFLGWKWTKKIFVMVNALKFWYLFKWFELFYLEFFVGVIFWTQLTLFLVKMEKKLLLLGWILLYFYIFSSEWSYSIWKSARVFYDSNKSRSRTI